MENSERDYNPLIVRYLDGSATEEEALHLLEWLESDTKNMQLFIGIRDLWITTGMNGKPDSETENALYRFKEKKQKQTESDQKKGSYFKLYTGKVFRIAASICLLLGTSLGMNIIYNRLTTDTTVVYNETIIPNGQKGQIVLSDGTKIWLNSGTSLRYPSNFGKGNREVFLKGEAYFEVKHKAAQPFLVHTDDIKVKVLGTSFNLRSYPGEDKVEATLIKGSIKLFKDDGENNAAITTLKPNEQATYNVQSKLTDVAVLKYEEADKNSKRIDKQIIKRELENLQPVKPHIETIIQWKDQKLVFENESLEDMVVRLERWFGKSIVIGNDELKKDKYSGKFEYHESIYQVLDVISASTGNISYYEKDHIIFINAN